MAVVIPAGCGGGDTDDYKAPTITVLAAEANVFGGAKVEQTDSSLLIGGEKVAEWKAGSGKVKTVALKFKGQDITLGTILSEKGTLGLIVTNDADKSDSKSINVTDEVIAGLGSLKTILQVDKEVNLTEGLTIAQGFELAKTEIEFEGQRTEIADPSHFTPEYPGTCSLFFSVKKKDTVGEVKADYLTIRPLDYKAIEITDINPEDLMPKVEV